jgi:hypothetical protein
MEIFQCICNWYPEGQELEHLVVCLRVHAYPVTAYIMGPRCPLLKIYPPASFRQHFSLPSLRRISAFHSFNSRARLSILLHNPKMQSIILTALFFAASASAAATTTFPSAAGETTFSDAPKSVSGTFDGKMARFGRGLACDSDDDGGEDGAVFILEDGATLKVGFPLLPPNTPSLTSDRTSSSDPTSSRVSTAMALAPSRTSGGRTSARMR